jgi:hypothetical protein
LATRRKQREAKLGTTQTPEQRAAKAEAIRRWWAARRGQTESQQVVSALLEK